MQGFQIAQAHRALGCSHRLDGAGVDDAQEEHGQVQRAQDVAHILYCGPAKVKLPAHAPISQAVTLLKQLKRP